MTLVSGSIQGPGKNDKVQSNRVTEERCIKGYLHKETVGVVKHSGSPTLRAA